MSTPVIEDLDLVLQDEIFKHQNNDGSMQTSYEIKKLIFAVLKKNWLFVSVLIIGNIGIIYLYRKFLKK